MRPGDTVCERVWVGLETVLAAGRAEIDPRALVLAHVRRGGPGYSHAADRIDCLEILFGRGGELVAAALAAEVIVMPRVYVAGFARIGINSHAADGIAGDGSGGGGHCEPPVRDVGFPVTGRSRDRQHGDTGMNIGQAARASGLPPKTIRYYEDIDLIRPSRGDNGYRDFSEADIHKLDFLARSRSLGFSIDDCRTLLSLYEDSDRASSEVKRIASQHLTRIGKKIDELEGLRRTLETPDRPLPWRRPSGLPDIGRPRRGRTPDKLRAAVPCRVLARRQSPLILARVACRTSVRYRQRKRVGQRWTGSGRSVMVGAPSVGRLPVHRLRGPGTGRTQWGSGSALSAGPS